MKHTYLYPLIGLAAILLLNAFFVPDFFVLEMRDGRLYGSLIDVLNRSVPVLLLATGMTLVIATKGVDLSVGAIMAISGAVGALLVVNRPAIGVPMIVLVSLVVGVAAGLFNGVLVGKVGIQPIVATLILMVGGRGIAQLLTGGQIIIFNNASLEALGTGSLFGLPVPVVIFAVVIAATALIVRKTALGLFVEASGSNAEAARLAGIASDRILIAVYAISGLMAGIAGVIACANIKAADANNTGLYMELDAILAVAVGGTSLMGGRFSLVGSVVGAILMQTLTTTILMEGVSPHLTLVAKALIIVVVVLLQSPEFRASFVRRKRDATAV